MDRIPIPAHGEKTLIARGLGLSEGEIGDEEVVTPIRLRGDQPGELATVLVFLQREMP